MEIDAIRRVGFSRANLVLRANVVWECLGLLHWEGDVGVDVQVT